MKSQKGMTMISLILYVSSFLAITATIAAITTFFYNNIEILDTSIGSSSQYNKFNLYFLNECKKANNELYAWKASDSLLRLDRLKEPGKIDKKFITFSSLDGTEKNSFIYDDINNDLYYNSIKLCDDVEDFQIKIDETTGKTVLSILIKIAGKVYTTDYVVSS